MNKDTNYQKLWKKNYQKNLNDNFNSAKEFVQETLGISLTLIELVELRKNVEFTSKIFLEDHAKYVKKEISRDPHSINPDSEAAYIFMNKNYGTQIHNIVDKFYFNDNQFETEKKVGFDYYSEFFKKMQSEMHFP